MNRAMRQVWTARMVCVWLMVLGSFGQAAAQLRTIEGKTSSGALYALQVPDNWNGNLVVYAHGIVDPGAPITLPSTQDGFHLLRDQWLARGYALAYSSYSENGYALRAAIAETGELRERFKDAFGHAQRVYLAGHSLGGLAVLSLAEKFPELYDGALPMCTPIGGGSAVIAHLGNARVAFDYFFPGVLPGGPFSVPAGTTFTPGSPVFNATLNALAAGLVMPGRPTLQFMSVARLPFTSVPEIIASGMTVAGFSVRYTNDVMARTDGAIPFDNIDTRYTGSANDSALNDPVTGIARFEADKQAARYFARFYTPSGDLRIPTLTLHTLFDPVAPFSQEADYAQVVASSGRTDLLVQRSVARYGHCAINAAETMDAFEALVLWSQGGPKPAGGNATR